MKLFILLLVLISSSIIDTSVGPYHGKKSIPGLKCHNCRALGSQLLQDCSEESFEKIRQTLIKDPVDGFQPNMTEKIDMCIKMISRSGSGQDLKLRVIRVGVNQNASNLLHEKWTLDKPKLGHDCVTKRGKNISMTTVTLCGCTTNLCNAGHFFQVLPSIIILMVLASLL